MAHLLQDPEEFISLCQLLRTENVRSYLEIGSFSGGSIELVATYLPKGSRIVVVDKPWNSTKAARLHGVLKRLKQEGYDTHLIAGDSTDPKVISAANKLGPYDAVFIDGDHRFSYVKNDWLNYGAMGRIIGFHDVARDLPQNQYGGPHEVASFWKSLKGDHVCAEFISDKTRARTDNKAAYGIGVIWNEQFGSQVQQAAGARYTRA
jgi:Methyltransferase domain